MSKTYRTDQPEHVVWEYSPAPESRSIVHLQSSYGLFIGGAFVEPVDGDSYRTENPATEEVLAEIAAAGLRDVDRAVEVAGRAQKTVWGPMAGAERAKYLFRIARIIQTTASRFANRATSTSRWRQLTSSTTRAGRTSSSTRVSGPIQPPLESPVRSFPGTSR